MPKGRPDKGYALTPQREKVLRILATAGGSLDDEAGLVVPKLRERTGHETTQALSMVIKQLEMAGLVKRDVAGRRTYHLELVTDALAPEDRERFGVANGHAAPAPAPTVLLEDDEPAETQSSDSGDSTDYRRLADELLKSALAAVAHKNGDPKLKARIVDLEGRLDETAERCRDLSAQLVERGEEVLRLKEALRIAEHNLDTVQKTKAREKAERGSDKIEARLTDRERKELADLKRLMQARPGG